MALDRFVYWKERCPTFQEVQHVLEDFFNGAAEVRRSTDRWICTLPGAPQSPLHRVDRLLVEAPDAHADGERWIEVFMHEDSLDIITRMADEYTNALAEGLARIFARYWQGKYQDE